MIVSKKVGRKVDGWRHSHKTKVFSAQRLSQIQPLLLWSEISMVKGQKGSVKRPKGKSEIAPKIGG